MDCQVDGRVKREDVARGREESELYPVIGGVENICINTKGSSENGLASIC